MMHIKILVEKITSSADQHKGEAIEEVVMERPGFSDRNEVAIQAGEATLYGFLDIPEHATQLVVFAHGSGSSRYSPRNNYVASVLRDGGLGTLLMDLLTPEEEAIDLVTQELRFDIDFLARRLCDIIDWCQTNPEAKEMGLGLFGSSTGAAAALIAAAEKRDAVSAVVSRGGRPDLATVSLPRVVAKTLFIVGENDSGVLELNQAAFEMLGGEKRLEIVPTATHLFVEPGTLEQVAGLARDWFKKQI